jgi:fumarate reductase flavoprotein subunit
MRRLLAGVSLLLGLGLVSSCAYAKIQGGPVPGDRLADGVYRGSARSGPVVAVVAVTVAERRVAEIEIVRHGHWRGGAAEEPIPRAIVEQQSTRVDVVTGATVSSVALMNAVQDALEKAMD